MFCQTKRWNLYKRFIHLKNHPSNFYNVVKNKDKQNGEMNVNKVGSETADGNTMLKLLFITVGSAAKHELYILKFMKSMKSMKFI